MKQYAIKAGKWGCALLLAAVCSACAQPNYSTTAWDKSYENGAAATSRVPNIGPSAGIF